MSDKKRSSMNWKKLGFEFVSIFIAVVSAFALNNWNENRKSAEAETKILIEINNGLETDLEDIAINKKGHLDGIRACNYWSQIVLKDSLIYPDSLGAHLFNLTRDFISIQNVSGYESLKSRGLELISSDSLRFQIISLYEYDYNILRKFEEEYAEMQFHESYFDTFNKLISPQFITSKDGMVTGLKSPMEISPADKNILLMNFSKILINRYFIYGFYEEIERKIALVQELIQQELQNN